jgi:hypothetical protein
MLINCAVQIVHSGAPESATPSGRARRQNGGPARVVQEQA